MPRMRDQGLATASPSLLRIDLVYLSEMRISELRPNEVGGSVVEGGDVTTLLCGHPKTSLTDRGECGACMRDAIEAFVVRDLAARNCGLPPGAFDDLTDDDHAAFHRAIVADPHPTGLDPRLVYASYLDEQGDPRGELIRVECELRAINQPRRGDLSSAAQIWIQGDLPRWQALFTRRAALRRQLGYDRPEAQEPANVVEVYFADGPWQGERRAIHPHAMGSGLSVPMREAGGRYGEFRYHLHRLADRSRRVYNVASALMNTEDLDADAVLRQMFPLRCLRCEGSECPRCGGTGRVNSAESL